MLKALPLVQVQLMADYILLKRDSAPTMQGQILLPEASRIPPGEGDVVAVGPGQWNMDGLTRRPMSVKVGQRIAFSPQHGVEVKVNGEVLWLLGEPYVLWIY